MALQGTLDTFSLPDVLRLLATTSKTGRLRIEGDRGHGSVWLSEGGVVDADADRVVEGTPTDEVVFELLRFGSGSFSFDGDDRAADPGKPEDVETLLRRSNSLLTEWSELENVVPSLEHEVHLAGDLSVDEVTIDADRWKTLVAVAAGRTVGELARELSLTELGVSRAVRDLVDLGVAEVDPPGTSPEPPPPPRARRGSDDVLRRSPASPRPEPSPVAPMGRQGPLTGDVPRAGWRQTGEMPSLGADRGGAASGNGRARPSLDATEAIPAPQPPPPAEPPSKGGLASRLGRNRNASSSGASPEPPTTGATPSIPEPPGRSSARRPSGPTARTNDTGRTRSTDAEPAPRSERPARRPAADEPGGLTRRTPAPPSGPNGSPFDGGRLGPPPAGAHDTGQIRPVGPSSLPPDLHWAADDTGSVPLNGGPPSSPFSGLSSLGPSRPVPGPAQPPVNDGEIAPHVAAMSPEARAAVQATVGNAGGSTGGRPGQGEDIAQRGRLISFLSTVR